MKKDLITSFSINCQRMVVKMLGLVCMLDGKGMKKGVNALKNFDLEKVKEAALFNLDYALECIQFCLKNGYIYRVSSSIQKVY